MVLPVQPNLSHPLSNAQLEELNIHLSRLEPPQILAWGLLHLPQLFQSTAFGLTGLAGIDMLSKLTPHPPALIFVDTLYHFQETLDLKDEVARRYNIPIHVYRPPSANTAREFEAQLGERLWETNDALYDYRAKVEPAQRAYAELGVKSIITGRRSSQGAARASLKPLEVDSTGLLKLNPFFAWSFARVKAYIDEHDVPVNKLLAQGYKSVGDWHSTAKSGEGEAGEREGRWKDQGKTECGLHANYFTLKRQAMKQQREAELRQKDEARDLGPLESSDINIDQTTTTPGRV